MKIALALCVGLLVPAVAFAQHPCDVVNPTVYREPSSQLASLRVGWCFQPVDTNGVPITEQVGFALQMNSGPDVDLGIVAPLSGPNAAGAYYFEARTTALAAGIITVKAYTVSLGMSAQSDPITLTLLGSPKKPVNTAIIRGD